MHRFDPAAFGLSDQPTATRRLEGEAETCELGAAAARGFADGTFIGLVGELGAGKTTFVQGLVRSLGGEASSPTYTLLNEYDLAPPVYHFDLYRLEDVGDLETTAYWDYVEDRRAIVVVEWIDRIPTAWFDRGAILELRHDGGARHASVWAKTAVERWVDVFADRTGTSAASGDDLP